MKTRSFIIALILLLTLVGTLLAGWVPEYAMKHYHQFADTEAIWGIPNFKDVASNLPFAIVGLWGIAFCLRRRQTPARNSWPVFFMAILLTGFGSAIYHWSPGDATLIWDRLPMAAAFGSLFIALSAEHMGPSIEKRFLLFALALSIGSVVLWATTGIVTLYGWVQFAPLLVIPLILLLFKPAYTHRWILLPALGSYFLAKVFEFYDSTIYVTSGFISGHTLKHIFAALAIFCILFMLTIRKRRI